MLNELALMTDQAQKGGVQHRLQQGVRGELGYAVGEAVMRGLRLLGSSAGVKEEIHAIRSRRGQHHPLVQKLMAAAAARTDA